MTCSGNCSMCGLPRDKVCQCFVRAGRVVDEIHPSLKVAEEYITTEKYFGHKKCETALELIQAARCEIRSHVAAGTLDGRVLMQVDKDAERLTRTAKGRLFATSQKDDSKSSHHSTGTDLATSNRALIAQFRERSGRTPQP